jgi:hypothetical protein
MIMGPVQENRKKAIPRSRLNLCPNCAQKKFKSFIAHHSAFFSLQSLDLMDRRAYAGSPLPREQPCRGKDGRF